MTKKQETKKQEKKDENWWRKYTKEYQDEDFEKKKEHVREKVNVEKPKKRVIRFSSDDLFPDMSDLASEMENMMRGFMKSSVFSDDFFKKPALPRLVKMKGGTFRKPISGVQQTKDKVLVSIELPGVKKEDIRIRVEGMNLIIEAQSKTGEENKKKGFFKFSSSYTGFRHIVRLPTPVEKEASSAHFESGVLRIALKKKKSGEFGDIPIE